MDLLLHQVFISSLALPQNTTPVSRRSLSEQVGNPCTGSLLWHKHWALYFFKLHIFVKLLSFFSIVTLKRKKKSNYQTTSPPPKKANKTQLAHLCSFYTHRWPLEVPSNSTIVWFYNSSVWCSRNECCWKLSFSCFSVIWLHTFPCCLYQWSHFGHSFPNQKSPAKKLSHAISKSLGCVPSREPPRPVFPEQPEKPLDLAHIVWVSVVVIGLPLNQQYRIINDMNLRLCGCVGLWKEALGWNYKVKLMEWFW